MKRGLLAIAVATAVLAGGVYVLTAEPRSGSGNFAPITQLDDAAVDAFPAVPAAQVESEHMFPVARRAPDGRQLLVPVPEHDCAHDEVRLAGEHLDRVELEVRSITKPPPADAEIRPGGDYACSYMVYGSPLAGGPHAIVQLRSPLGGRKVRIRLAG